MMSEQAKGIWGQIFFTFNFQIVIRFGFQNWSIFNT